MSYTKENLPILITQYQEILESRIRAMKEVETRIEVMKAYVAGSPIERLDKSGVWLSYDGVPAAWGIYDYRITPPKPDEIDWSHIHEKYNFMARDKDSPGLVNVWIFTKMPVKGASFWSAGDGHMVEGHPFKSYKRGNLSWEDSLVIRPGFEYER